MRRGIKGRKWDNCNNIINKIYLKTFLVYIYMSTKFLRCKDTINHSEISLSWPRVLTLSCV